MNDVTNLGMMMKFPPKVRIPLPAQIQHPITATQMYPIDTSKIKLPPLLSSNLTNVAAK